MRRNAFAHQHTIRVATFERTEVRVQRIDAVCSQDRSLRGATRPPVFPARGAWAAIQPLLPSSTPSSLARTSAECLELLHHREFQANKFSFLARAAAPWRTGAFIGRSLPPPPGRVGEPASVFRLRAEPRQAESTSHRRHPPCQQPEATRAASSSTPSSTSRHSTSALGI